MPHRTVTAVPAPAPGSHRLDQGRTLLLVLAAYFAFNVLVRLLLPHSLELDEAEQTYFSQWLIGGYSSQPPFYNWLQYGVVHLFGASLASLAMLKNLMLLAGYLFYYLAARQVVKDDRLAILAALGLLTIPQVSFEAQRDLSHTVASIFASAFFLYAFLRACRTPSAAAFALLGVAIGIGGIAKYNFALLPIVSLLALAAEPTLRGRLADWRIPIAVIIALMIVWPHVYWLLQNFEATSSHTMDKLVGTDTSVFSAILTGLGSLAAACLGFGALTVVLFALSYREQVRTIWRASNVESRLIGRILGFSVVAIILMVLFAGVENVRDRWLTPLLLPLPLYLVAKIGAAGIETRLGSRRLWAIAGAIMVIVPLAIAAKTLSAPWTGKYSYKNYPLARIAADVSRQIGSVPTLVVAQNAHMAGNLRLTLPPSIPVMTPVWPTGILSMPQPPHEQILFVWYDRDGDAPGEMPKTYRDYLAQRGVSQQGDIRISDYPYIYGKPGDQFVVAYELVRLPSN